MSDLYIGSGRFMLGDCLERMKEIPSGSVDMILCDLPYGTTACKWDQIIPFEPLWREYWRVCAPDAAVVLTASQPFTSALVMSQPEKFAFAWSWNKVFGGNFVQAKRQPIKTHEDVLVFCVSGKQPIYYPQMIKRDKPIRAGKVENQQSAIPSRSGKNAIDLVKKKIYDEKYPVSTIKFSSRDASRGLHPTQKPVALFEYLIRTYTDENAVVLDNCAGSGTTAIAAERTNRRWICIERDPEYFAKACDRVRTEVDTKKQDLFP